MIDDITVLWICPHVADQPVKTFVAPFQKFEFMEFYFLNWFYTTKGRKPLLEKIDFKALEILPWFRKWCRIIVICAIK